MMSSGVPSAITRPPCTPAPGPISTTWSAVKIASSSCSTTITVLPRSRSRRSVSSSPRVVALMQPDRRLVEHVEHPCEPGTDLRGQADALALTTRQRARIARQCKIIEADIDQEAEALADFLQDASGDLGLLLREACRDFFEPAVRATDRHMGDFSDVETADLDRQRLRLQPLAAACLAGMIGLVARKLLAHPLAVGLPPAPLDVGDDALECLFRRVVTDAVFVGEADLLRRRNRTGCNPGPFWADPTTIPTSTP